MAELEAPPSKLDILEVETFGRGGLAHYVDNLSRALAGRGHRVTILTAARHEFSAPEDDRGDAGRGAVVVEPRLARWSAPQPEGAGRTRGGLRRKIEAIADALRTVAFARSRRPDVVHLHSTNPIALLHAILLRLAGQRLVATAHVVTPHEPLPLQSVLYRILHRLCHRVIAHSEFDRRRLIEEFGVHAAAVVVIPHGEYGFFARRAAPLDAASARRGLGLEPQHEVALFFGYLREYKGLDVLLEAWAEVAHRRPRAKLLVVGDPVRLSAERRRELEATAHRLGAITRLGYVPFDDVAGIFAAADVLAMPYRRVSQSGVLYLGLALGVPVVATRIGAWAEMLSDGVDALLVAPDSPSELAQAIVRCLEDSTLRRQLVDGGRRIAEEHSWPHIAAKTEAALGW